MPTEVVPRQGAPPAVPGVPNNPFIAPPPQGAQVVQGPLAVHQAAGTQVLPLPAAPQRHQGYSFETLMRLVVATMTSSLGSKFCACVIHIYSQAWLAVKEAVYLHNLFIFRRGTLAQLQFQLTSNTNCTPSSQLWHTSGRHSTSLGMVWSTTWTQRWGPMS